MQRVLFHDTVFGPIHSRRLGTSLGVNLSPNDGKICSFDCLYCEAGFNAQGPGTTGFPPREIVAEKLESKLRTMKDKGEELDVITFSGNGEPTLHPQFAAIIDDTIRLRDRYFPNVKISVLSNATRLGDASVAEALKKVDNNILKLDSAVTSTLQIIDRPNSPDFSSEKVISQLEEFGNDCIIQTMLLRGEYNGHIVDNTTTEEVNALINAYHKIKPKEVMLYSIDRKTPAENLIKVNSDELKQIADIMKEAGIPVASF